MKVTSDGIITSQRVRWFWHSKQGLSCGLQQRWKSMNYHGAGMSDNPKVSFRNGLATCCTISSSEFWSPVPTMLMSAPTMAGTPLVNRAGAGEGAPSSCDISPHSLSIQREYTIINAPTSVTKKLMSFRRHWRNPWQVILPQPDGVKIQQHYCTSPSWERVHHLTLQLSVTAPQKINGTAYEHTEDFSSVTKI